MKRLIDIASRFIIITILLIAALPLVVVAWAVIWVGMMALLLYFVVGASIGRGPWRS